MPKRPDLDAVHRYLKLTASADAPERTPAERESFRRKAEAMCAEYTENGGLEAAARRAQAAVQGASSPQTASNPLSGLNFGDLASSVLSAVREGERVMSELDEAVHRAGLRSLESTGRDAAIKPIVTFDGEVAFIVRANAWALSDDPRKCRALARRFLGVLQAAVDDPELVL
jgi:hypothetical protein